MHVFISYSSADKAFAVRLRRALEERSVPCWSDESIAPGEQFRNSIERALHDASCVVVIWTPNSVSSPWVLDESSTAVARGILVPVSLNETCAPPLGFRQLHTPVLRQEDLSLDSRAGQGLFASIIKLHHGALERTFESGPPALHEQLLSEASDDHQLDGLTLIARSSTTSVRLQVHGNQLHFFHDVSDSPVSEKPHHILSRFDALRFIEPVRRNGAWVIQVSKSLSGLDRLIVFIFGADQAAPWEYFVDEERSSLTVERLWRHLREGTRPL